MCTPVSRPPVVSYTGHALWTARLSCLRVAFCARSPAVKCSHHSRSTVSMLLSGSGGILLFHEPTSDKVLKLKTLDGQVGLVYRSGVCPPIIAWKPISVILQH